MFFSEPRIYYINLFKGEDGSKYWRFHESTKERGNMKYTLYSSPLKLHKKEQDNGDDTAVRKMARNSN